MVVAHNLPREYGVGGNLILDDVNYGLFYLLVSHPCYNSPINKNHCYDSNNFMMYIIMAYVVKLLEYERNEVKEEIR